MKHLISRLAVAAVAATLAVTACGSKQKGTSPHDLDEAVEANRQVECNAGDISACVDLARAGCTDKVWQLDFEDSPALYLSDNGLARLDRPGMMLFSTNASEWMACVEKCPGGADAICLPFGLDMDFSTVTGDTCQVTHRDIHPWNGHDTKSMKMDCPDGTWEVSYVPELAPVQKALVRSGAVADTDMLAKVDGLVVNVSFSGIAITAVSKVSKGSCRLFDLPENHKVVRGRKAFDDLRKMHPKLDALVAAKLAEARSDDLETKARMQIEPQLIELCTKSGFPVSSLEEMETCLNEVATARAMLARVTSLVLDRFAKEIEPQLREQLRADYLGPLCKHFTGVE
jgi:hypothetical protein